MRYFPVSLLLLYVFASQTALSQSHIIGTLAESTGEPLAYANVLLLHPNDSSLVKGMISGNDGRFILEDVLPGHYLLVVSMIGYQRYQRSVHMEKRPLLLDTLLIIESTRELDEVVVHSQKPLYEQHIDRLVVNVQSSITAAGSTALEVLERSPGITIDRQNNVLSMNGKGGVQVMINGKPSRLPPSAVIQMLEGMNARNIEKIELINSPSARYDAEGSAGLLNIVLIKNMEYGTNGALSATAGYGRYGKSGTSFNLNHRQEKLNIYGDYSWSYNHSWYELGNIRMVVHQGLPTETSSIGNGSYKLITHTPRLGFDYSLSPATTIGGVLSGFWNRQLTETLNTIRIQEEQIVSSLVDMNTVETNLWQHGMGNLNVRHSLSDKQEVSLDLDYLVFRNSSPAAYGIHYQFPETGDRVQEKIKVDKITPIGSWIAKADYVYHLSDNSKLEVGAKGAFTRLDNEVRVDWRMKDGWKNDPQLSQEIDMTENILAAYTNLSLQMSPKTSMQAGLRWEHTYTHINSPEQKNLVLRNYHQLFPSLAFSRELNPNNKLQFSYSRRISRPTFNNLAPFVSFKDPYSFWSGNTALQPTITDALQASYQLKKQYLLSLQASFDKNAVTWLVQLDPETNKQNVYIANTDQTNTYSLNLTIPLSVAPWWQMQNTMAAIWQQNSTMYEGTSLHINGRSGRINSTQNFKLPYNFNLEVSAFYQSRALYGIFRQTSTGSLNMGIQKKLKNDWGTLNFNISDIFWTNRFRIRLAYPSVNLDQVFYYTPEPRVLRLTYSRNFGNKKVKAASHRKTGSEDERNRVQ